MLRADVSWFDESSVTCLYTFVYMVTMNHKAVVCCCGTGHGHAGAQFMGCLEHTRPGHEPGDGSLYSSRGAVHTQGPAQQGVSAILTSHHINSSRRVSGKQFGCVTLAAAAFAGGWQLEFSARSRLWNALVASLQSDCGLVTHLSSPVHDKGWLPNASVCRHEKILVLLGIAAAWIQQPLQLCSPKELPHGCCGNAEQYQNATLMVVILLRSSACLVLSILCCCPWPTLIHPIVTYLILQLCAW